MSQDYKQNRYAERDREPPARGGAFKGVLYGLVLGFIIAAAVAWWFNHLPSPLIDRTGNNPGAPVKPPASAEAPAPAQQPAEAPAAAPAAPATNSVPAEPGKPIVLPGKPGDTVPEKRFQFPDILSGKTDGTTTKPAPAAKPVESSKPVEPAKAGDGAKPAEPPRSAPDTASKSPEAPAGVYLMAGSFQKQSDAETQKATLALNGFDATVQKAIIGEKVWYRVKLGPFQRQDDANRVRNELKESGIDAVPAARN